MAFSAGYVATLSVNSVDISPFIKSVKFQPARKSYELPVLGGGTVRRMVGPVATMVDIDGFLDPTVDTVFTARMAETTPTSVAVSYKPQGAGGATWSGNAFVVKFDASTPAEGPGTFIAQLAVDGTVTFA